MSSKMLRVNHCLSLIWILEFRAEGFKSVIYNIYIHSYTFIILYTHMYSCYSSSQFIYQYIFSKYSDWIGQFNFRIYSLWVRHIWDETGKVDSMYTVIIHFSVRTFALLKRFVYELWSLSANLLKDYTKLLKWEFIHVSLSLLIFSPSYIALKRLANIFSEKRNPLLL
jgi:hypothetical protein